MWSVSAFFTCQADFMACFHCVNNSYIPKYIVPFACFWKSDDEVCDSNHMLKGLERVSTAAQLASSLWSHSLPCLPYFAAFQSLAKGTPLQSNYLSANFQIPCWWITFRAVSVMVKTIGGGESDNVVRFRNLQVRRSYHRAGTLFYKNKNKKTAK